MIEENLQKIFNEIKNGNDKGEKITLVGATKFVPVENINLAIQNGLTDIAENKAQEFRDKFDKVLPVNYHFIGRLQKNKIKYLIGKVYLIQSVDSLELLEEIDRQSKEKKIITNVLLEISPVGEESKGGISLENLDNILTVAETYKNIKILGLMAMLPESNDEDILVAIMKNIREIYDFYKEKYGFIYLSVGMTGDYKLCIKHGSNMIRIGTGIFGGRIYGV